MCLHFIHIIVLPTLKPPLYQQMWAFFTHSRYIARAFVVVDTHYEVNYTSKIHVFLNVRT